MTEQHTRSGLNRRQMKVVALSSSGGFVDGFDLIMLGSAIILIKPQFHLSAWAIGGLTASAYAGAAIAAIVAGYLTDLIGRRAIFISSLGLMVIASALSGLSPNLWTLLALRFVVGLGIGTDLPTAGAMTAEFVPARNRGAALAGWQLAWTAGALACPAVAVALLPLGSDAWRWMLGSCAIPALVVLLARHAVPETPQWLAMKGRTEQAAEISAWAGVRTEQFEHPGEDGQLKRSLALLRGPFRRNLTILSLLCICGSVASLFLGSYSAFLAKVVGATSDRTAILFGMVIWAAYLLGNLVNMAVTDRIGRKPLLVGGGAVTAAALLAAGQTGLSRTDGPLIFAIFAIGAFSYWGGVNQAIWQYAAELFPTEVRGTARGFAVSWTRIAAVFTGLFTPTMIADLGFAVSMWIFALFALGVVACGALLPEVKGRELTDIAADQERRYARHARPERTAAMLNP